MNEANAGPSDEALMAYADGEASAEDAAAVEAAIAADPAVADRLALFAATRTAAAQAFPLEPVPDALRASVESMIASGNASGLASAGGAANDGSAPELPEGENVVAFRRRGSGRHRAPRTMMAMAASLSAVAIAVGAFLAGSQFGRPAAPGAPPGGVAALAALPLSEALAMPSGEALAAGPDTTMRTLATFRSGAGELCREFEVEGDASVLAVACRREGAWSVDFAVAEAPDPGGYVPASGMEALDAFLGTIDAEPPLGAGEEARALESIR